MLVGIASSVCPFGEKREHLFPVIWQTYYLLDAMFVELWGYAGKEFFLPLFIHLPSGPICNVTVPSNRKPKPKC